MGRAFGDFFRENQIYERRRRALYQPGAAPQEKVTTSDQGLKARPIASFEITPGETSLTQRAIRGGIQVLFLLDAPRRLCLNSGNPHGIRCDEHPGRL